MFPLLPKCLESGGNLGDLLGDSSLTGPVVCQAQRADHLFGIVAGSFHGGTPGCLFRCEGCLLYTSKSLALIFVYTVATGSIFTYVSYWDSVFFSYCGPGTFLAFALMTLAILPIALVYSEISPLFHTAGGEPVSYTHLDVYKRQAPI